MTAPCDARCCDAAEVPLLEADIRRLSATTGRPAAGFVEEADGWRVLRGTGVDGGCVFLGRVTIGGRDVPGCTVHDARPEACRHYPFILVDGPDGPTLGRDGLCPFRGRFETPPDTLERLVALERQLEEERMARGRPDGG